MFQPRHTHGAEGELLFPGSCAFQHPASATVLVQGVHPWQNILYLSNTEHRTLQQSHRSHPGATSADLFLIHSVPTPNHWKNYVYFSLTAPVSCWSKGAKCKSKHVQHLPRAESSSSSSSRRELPARQEPFGGILPCSCPLSPGMRSGCLFLGIQPWKEHPGP